MSQGDLQKRKQTSAGKPSNHAAQPFPATNGEAKVFGLLSQLLDRFAPEEPQITYVQRPAGSHAAVPVANQSQKATAVVATTAPESQTSSEA